MSARRPPDHKSGAVRILSLLIAIAALTTTAKAADPLADLYAGPYIMIDEADATVSSDIRKKRPLLLMFTQKMWAVNGDTSGMATDRNASFKSLAEFLAIDAQPNAR